MSPIDNEKLYIDSDMEQSEVLELATGDASVFSSSCPESANSNQDAAAIFEVDKDTAILVVADGVGGSLSGEKASKRTINSIAKSLNKTREKEQLIRDLIIDGIEEANKAVLELGNGAASTLAIVEIQGHSIRTYHVGDSGIISVGQRGKIKLQTIPHSPVGYALESGLLEEDDALHHDALHIVSNVVGSSDMRIEIGPTHKLSNRDTVVVASDGLLDNLSITEIIDKIRCGPLNKAANALATDCSKRMTSPQNGHPSKPDDLTFIAFRLKS